MGKLCVCEMGGMMSDSLDGWMFVKGVESGYTSFVLLVGTRRRAKGGEGMAENSRQ